jgi:hypothetical protein
MGFRIALYTSSLFSSDNCDFWLMIQYSLRILRSSFFLFVDMFLRQVSFRSRCIARYFTSSGWVSCLLLSWTGGHVFFFKVKVLMETKARIQNTDTHANKCNNYCFSTSKMVTRTRLDFAFYVRDLCC